ncbi:MAG: hypothetical protein WDO15_20320 [Bacteroidota bacterium]
MTTRIFIADDHRLMLAGLATLIESIEGFSLVGKFHSGKELIEALQKTSPHPTSVSSISKCPEWMELKP